jgi:nucleotide-binding universal stress UspA family protein
MSSGKKMKLLIPLDGSPVGDATLLALFPLLRSGQAECTLFHVGETPNLAPDLIARLSTHRRALEGQGITARIHFAGGKPAEEILREAGTGDFDLVAMATHGRTGLDRVLMGSVAEEVVRSSPIPTLLCKANTGKDDWTRIVVALDGTSGAEEVLDDAVALARRLGATLHLLQVGLGLLMSDGYRGVSCSVSERSTTYVENVAARLIADGIPVVAERRTGLIALEIAHFAQELDAGLICMTTEGRPEQLPGMDRSVAAEVIRGAPCPVYVRRMTRKPAEAR